MTPPDQPEEQPSALSRLERALAGFGDPARADEPVAESETAAVVEADEPEPEPEPEPEREPERELPSFAAEDEEDDDDVEEWEPAPVASSSVLDIASAVDAIERLSAVQEAEPEHVSAIDALDEKWAHEQPDELPRFEPADLRSRIKEFDEEDETDDDETDDDETDDDVGAIAEAEAGLPDEIEEEIAVDEPVEEEEPPSRDAAMRWNRDLSDTSLPYFLVEDNRPVAAEPVAVTATPTLEELREVNAEREEKQTASIVRTLAEIPILLIVAALIAFLVKTFLAQAYYIPSGSMLPQLQIDDRVVVSKLAYKAHDPRRGDIVVFDDPTKNGEDEPDEGFLRKVGEGIGIVQPSTDEFIKRVVALPGETVEGRDGHVFINGRRLYEPYLTDSVVTADFDRTTVKPGHLWVMGDNRSSSADSRVFGQIDTDTIVGRAVVTVWPFGSAEFL
jgi:signal peptidase I